MPHVADALPPRSGAFSTFDVRALTPVPWKNGGGTTREVVSWPDAGDFDWRASVATIDSSGPFSSFPGIDRTIMLLEGDGVSLQIGEKGEHRLDQPLSPFKFPGDTTIQAKLLGGPSIDFNLMIRRGRLRGGVRILTAGDRIEPSQHGLLMSLAGTWKLRVGSLETHCPVHQGLWWTNIYQCAQTVAETLDEEAGAILLAIGLDPL